MQVEQMKSLICYTCIYEILLSSENDLKSKDWSQILFLKKTKKFEFEKNFMAIRISDEFIFEPPWSYI